MQHRTEAIRIVNERLQSPLQALSDGTIATVANMAVYEVSYSLNYVVWGQLLTGDIVLERVHEKYGGTFERSS